MPAHGEDAEIRRDLRPVHHAVEIEHAGVAGRQRENEKHQYRAGNRGEFGAVQHMAEPGFLAQPFIRIGHRGRCLAGIRLDVRWEVFAGYTHDVSLEPGRVRLAREDAWREQQPVKCAVAAGGPPVSKRCPPCA
jgi:hypothetical protein